MNRRLSIGSAFVALLVVALVISFTYVILRSNATKDLAPRGGSSVDEGLPQNDRTLTPTSCTEAGGTWNGCGSACRTNPEAICIDLCVEYCECQSDDQCPAGSVCGDFVDGVGVCL